MPLINCKVELKLKWTKYGVLSAAGADNTDIILIISIFYKRGKIICLSAKRQSKITNSS